MSVWSHIRFACLSANLSFLFWTWSAYGQSASFTNQQAFYGHNGIILLPDMRPIGSGFVIGKGKEVVTCWHVLEGARTVFHQTNLLFGAANKTYRLTVKRELSSYDLASFSIIPQIEGEPFPAGDFGNINPGDFVLYLGFDARASKTNLISLMHFARVSGKGPIIFNNVKTDALFFAGDGIQGYSGGAVFSTNMEIVAVFSAMGGKSTIYDGREGALNIAYTIAPLFGAEKSPQKK